MPPPSPNRFAMVAVVKGFLFLGIYMYLMNQVPLDKLNEPQYLKWGFLHRVGYQYLCAFTARWKYYFVWSLSEASMIISGFGFSGWTKVFPSEEKQPNWTRAKNVDILRVELPRSAVEIAQYWNIHVGIWLRHCIHFCVLPFWFYFWLLVVSPGWVVSYSLQPVNCLCIQKGGRAWGRLGCQFTCMVSSWHVPYRCIWETYKERRESWIPAAPCNSSNECSVACAFLSLPSYFVTCMMLSENCSAYTIIKIEWLNSGNVGWNRGCILGIFSFLSTLPSWLLVQEVNIGLTLCW